MLEKKCSAAPESIVYIETSKSISKNEWKKIAEQLKISNMILQI